MPFLEPTMRWFGPADTVPLRHIRQAGATGVVTALHHVPNGAVWPAEEIRRRQKEIADAGLRWSVVESVPVHESIKLGLPERERYLENYARTLRHLAEAGLRVVCTNFMALKDWTRTDLAWRTPDGCETVRFDAVDFAVFDRHILQRVGCERDHGEAVLAAAERRAAAMSDAQKAHLARQVMFGLPGTVADFSLEEFRAGLRRYEGLDDTAFRANHRAFLEAVLPVAEACGIVLALHPDDPPFRVFGLPRIAGTEADLAALFRAGDAPANGLTFCSGSLGARADNDLPAIVRRFASRIHFVHLRNVRLEPDGGFHEAAHLGGSTDMAAVMRALLEEVARRADAGDTRPIPLRPDHGHRMLHDLDAPVYYPGYSAIGRLRGLAELRGLELGLRAALYADRTL